MLGFLICLIFAGLLAVSAFLETKPNKNILIGVKLPLAHQKDEPVLAIVKNIRGNCCSCAGSPCCWPCR